MTAINPVPYCRSGATAAVVFIHGFTGAAISTWDGFPNRLIQDPDLTDYDFYFWEYPTDLKLRYAITKYFWEDDPTIGTIGQGLRTLLDHSMEPYGKLVLVGHSMGGLVIQAFILEEIQKEQPSRHLDRLTEVILYGTPSGGLKSAGWGAFLKRQIADMDDCGVFIKKLRSGWNQMVDDRRPDPSRKAQFRLTLVAGMKDEFVLQESSLNPFPLDESEIVPGNHTEMVKPDIVGDLPYRVLKKRLIRPALTKLQRRLIQGEDEEVIRQIHRIDAATDLDDLETLMEIATKLLNHPESQLPLVDRALGFALLGQEQYSQAADLLQRYVTFKMPESQLPKDQTQPFYSDTQAIQQLAIALSGVGQLTEAVTWINELPPEAREEPETQGVLAGRFKCQWLKSRRSHALGQRTFLLYQAAFQRATELGRQDQITYNGINAAYMSFALGDETYKNLAREVLIACQQISTPDYWTDATRAEAYLLLQEYIDAAKAYREAHYREHPGRYWSSTGQQALDIIERQGNPPEASDIIDLFKDIEQDY